MILDYNSCLMNQKAIGSIEEIGNEIFNATEHRMKDFLFEEKMYNPFDGMSKNERKFCQKHKNKIDRNFNIVTQDQHMRELFKITSKRVQKLLDQAIAKQNFK